MTAYRLQRLSAGVLAGMAGGLAASALECVRGLLDGREFLLPALLAGMALAVAGGAVAGAWLGAVLAGLNWNEPLRASLVTLGRWLRVESRHRETEKVAAVTTALLGAGAFLGVGNAAVRVLAGRIHRPGLEALAIVLVLGALALALRLAAPAVRDALEDAVEWRGRVVDRQLGVVSVAGMLAGLMVGVGAAGFALRAPLAAFLYRLDAGPWVAGACAAAGALLAVLMLAWGPGARLVDLVATPGRLAAVLAAALAAGAWGNAALADAATREAALELQPTPGAAWLLVRGPVDDDTPPPGPDADEPLPEEPEVPPVLPAGIPDGGPDPARLRRIVFLSLDTVRADHLGAWGYTRHPTSPNLDALAAGGVRFARAYSGAPCSAASFMGILTSTLPSRLRGLRRDGDVFTLPAQGVVTLASRLRQGGWHTRGLLPVIGDYLKGVDRGFEKFDGSFHYAEVLAEQALKELARPDDGRPTFHWFHFIDAHHPYDTHRGFAKFGRAPADLYDQEIAYMDHQVGRLVQALREDPRADRTLLVLFSDHGEAFGEHGTTLHGNSLHDEEIRVPLVFHGPGITPRAVDAPVSLLDVGPTVLELAGIPWRGRPPEGRSLAPVLHGGEADAARWVLAEGCKPATMMALIGGQKMFYRQRSDLYYLYDLTTDPRERRNIFRNFPGAPELATRVKQEMRQRP
ncbi:MAG: sulfatase [Deltaproteobacteria bacterium]|nr:sulfatase [Deltaproteobacteria bacterium]